MGGNKPPTHAMSHEPVERERRVQGAVDRPPTHATSHKR